MKASQGTLHPGRGAGIRCPQGAAPYHGPMSDRIDSSGASPASGAPISAAPLEPTGAPGASDPSARPTLLSLTGVGRRYGARWVLRDLSLAIASGERVALLGESGSGKSTLLNLIAGLEPADTGEIRIGGRAVHGLDPDQAAQLRSTELGFVFQAFHLIGHLNLAQNVAVPLLLQGMARRPALERAGALLARVGLADRHASLPRELSGGEQQRVALARALVHRPRLVLADEPTGNLDAASAGRAIELLRDEIAASGAALLMVTHSQQAAAACDRRLTLDASGLRDLA